MNEEGIGIHDAGFEAYESGISDGDSGAANETGQKCSAEWCSLGLMKMFCPSCFLMGVIIFPIEALIRGGVRLIRGR